MIWSHTAFSSRFVGLNIVKNSRSTSILHFFAAFVWTFLQPIWLTLHWSKIHSKINLYILIFPKEWKESHEFRPSLLQSPASASELSAAAQARAEEPLEMRLQAERNIPRSSSEWSPASIISRLTDSFAITASTCGFGLEKTRKFLQTNKPEVSKKGRLVRATLKKLGQVRQLGGTDLKLLELEAMWPWIKVVQHMKFVRSYWN